MKLRAKLREFKNRDKERTACTGSACASRDEISEADGMAKADGVKADGAEISESDGMAKADGTVKAAAYEGENSLHTSCEIRIVQLRKEHLRDAAELERECFTHPWSDRDISDTMQLENTFFLAAENTQERLVGYIGVLTAGGEAHITNIAVSSAYRRRGVGTKLLEGACESARERDCEFLSLEVRISNEPAIGLYTKAGFKKVGGRRDFYTDPREDAFIMTKYFDEG